jgi:hypothetical protein
VCPASHSGISNRNLFYVTCGAAFTKASYTQSYPDAGKPSGSGVSTGSKSLVGWTARRHAAAGTE